MSVEGCCCRFISYIMARPLQEVGERLLTSCVDFLSSIGPAWCKQLPLSSVVKAATQDNPRIKLSKEAKAALVRSATVFLVYMATAYVWELHNLVAVSVSLGSACLTQWR